ncbi:MAG: porin [Paraburkholderia sp.]|jgi:outer membrane protein OmpU|nr:porin [Paraburkholderia sp.]
MKYQAAAGAILQALSISALAQSSVTLFGSIDDGVTYINNTGGHSAVKLQDGVNKSNSLGFAGTEDLGNGTSALFKLENGYSANNGKLGQGGLLFGKQAWVGLAQRGIGQVLLGRQYDYTVVLEQYTACNNCGIYAYQNADIDRAAGQRLNNAVSVKSNTFGGFTFGAMYAFGQDSGALTTNSGRAYSAQVQYSAGPFSALALITDVNGAPVAAGSFGTSSVLGRPVTASTAFFVDNLRVAALAAYYQIGAWRPSITYSNSQIKLGGAKSTDQILRVGTTFALTPAALFAAQVAVDRFESSRWYSLALGADYLLSKRTDVYLDFEAQHASGAGTAASIFLAGPSSTSHQVVARAGIKHLF